MLFFGHAGLTLGAALMVTGALARYQQLDSPEESKPIPRPHRGMGRLLASVAGRSAAWLVTLGRRIDIRFLLIGALLADIIDKPLGILFFSETISNGRIYGHTLLFVVILAIGGLYLYRKLHKGWLLVIASSSFMHLILDEMWRTPQTLFWPLQGLSFEKIDLSNWVQGLYQALVTEPTISISEPVGAAVIIWFVWQLAHRGNLYAFILRGRI